MYSSRTKLQIFLSRCCWYTWLVCSLRTGSTLFLTIVASEKPMKMKTKHCQCRLDLQNIHIATVTCHSYPTQAPLGKSGIKVPLLPQYSAVNKRHVCLSRLLNAVTASQLDYTSHIPIVAKTEKRTYSDRMHKLYATDVVLLKDSISM